MSECTSVVREPARAPALTSESGEQRLLLAILPRFWCSYDGRQPEVEHYSRSDTQRGGRLSAAAQRDLSYLTGPVLPFAVLPAMARALATAQPDIQSALVRSASSVQQGARYNVGERAGLVEGTPESYSVKALLLSLCCPQGMLLPKGLYFGRRGLKKK